MKLHIGVDDALGLIHDIATTPANAHDITQTENLLHGEEGRVRAKVEHPFLIIKKTFGYSKVRYRGLAKNTNRRYVLAAFANLLLARKFMKS